MLLMAASLGCLEYSLHEGPRWDWFDDATIRIAVFVAVVGGALFFWRVLTYRQPIVDLRAFLNRNFALGTFLHLHHRHRHVRHDLPGAIVFWPRCAATTHWRSA